jgi:hypothetical protein
MKSLQRVPHVGAVVILTLALVGSSACTTGPRLAFSGNWVSQLPAGSAILFTAQQRGSTITGTVTNFGPLSTNASPLTGTVTNEGVTLAFSFPPGSVYGPHQAAVPWTFQGQFTSATTISGTAQSATGITGEMVITQNNGPLPLARAHALAR